MLTPEQAKKNRETFSRLTAEGDGLIAKAKAEKRELSDEEATRLEAIQATCEALGAFPDPIALGEDGGATEAHGGALTDPRWESLCAHQGVSIGLDDWESPAEFFSTIVNRIHDPRLQRHAMGTRVGDEGGFLVPTGISSAIMNIALEQEVIRSRATLVPMPSRSMNFPLFDSYDRSGGSVTGITASWVPEHGTPGEQQPKVQLVSLSAKKFMVLCRLSSELLEDVAGLSGQLTAALGRAVGYHLDDSFLNGAGAATPQGVLNSPALIVVDAEGSQSADTILNENILKMQSRLAPGSWRNSVWIAHPSALPQLHTLQIEIGTGGSLTSAITRGADGNMSLYSRPLLISEKAPVLGEQGDIGIYDLSRYLIGMRSELRIETSQHASFSSDEVLLKLRLRLDAKGMDGQTQLPKAGLSLSPFVTLAAR